MDSKPFNFTKILMLHNSYQYIGGEDSSTTAEIEVLRQAGHKVLLIEENNNRIKQFSPLNKLQLFFSAAWNDQKYQEMRSLLQELSPDLFHVQNFFPLFSPSIHAAAKSLNIPTIQHLRNFRLGCLNGYLFRENMVCETCVGKNPWPGLINRCYRNSLPESLGVWNMITHNRWRKTWHQDVNAFIAPSHFAAQKLVEIGIPSDRLYVKPNVTPDPLINESITPFPQIPTFLFIGRLSSEKGIMTLLKAWKKLAQSDWKLQIVGDGQQKKELEIYANEHSLTNVKFKGYQPKNIIIELIKKSTTVVVPSQWYETFGRVVIEAFACGRSALVSKIGALSELVTEGETGFLINPTHIDAWVERLEWYGKNNLDISQMSHKCRQIYLKKYTPEINYQQLINIYNRVN